MSPRRAALLAAFLLTLAPIAGCVSAPSKPASPVSSSPAGNPSPVVSQPLDDDEGFGDAPSAAPDPQAVAVAQDYLRAWARPDLDPKAWLAGVARYATPAYGQLLATVDPGNVPARQVTGPPATVSSSTAVVVAVIPTDTGPVRVTCTKTAGRWLVAGAEPAGTPGVGGD